LYLAALQVGEHTTQLRIAIASELTTITIRKRCTEIDQILKQRTGQVSHVPNSKTEETVLDSQENDMR
jgi:transcription initiation factor TFIIB